MKNKNRVSRGDFSNGNGNGHRDVSGILAKAAASNRKAQAIEDGFVPQLSADDLNGNTVEGRIAEIEDWTFGKKNGTTLHLVNGDFRFRIPLYTVIANKLARYQDRKELDRKKAVGLTIRVTGLGRGEAKKGQSAPALFDVAVVR